MKGYGPLPFIGRSLFGGDDEVCTARNCLTYEYLTVGSCVGGSGMIKRHGNSWAKTFLRLVQFRPAGRMSLDLVTV